jgi:hypothetical protein
MANPSNQDICNSIKALETKMSSSFEALHTTIAGLQSRLEEKDNEVRALKKNQEELYNDVLSLKTELNNIRQEERGSNLRLFGLNVSAEDIAAVGDSKAIIKRAYDTILKPILTAAKANGGIAAVPPPQHPADSCPPCWQALQRQAGKNSTCPLHHQVCIPADEECRA